LTLVVCKGDADDEEEDDGDDGDMMMW